MASAAPGGGPFHEAVATSTPLARPTAAEAAPARCSSLFDRTFPLRSTGKADIADRALLLLRPVTMGRRSPARVLATEPGRPLNSLVRRIGECRHGIRGPNLSRSRPPRIPSLRAYRHAGD